MRQIWKFQIPLSHSIKLQIPKGSMILHFGTQYTAEGHEEMCIWVEIDDKADLEEKTLMLIGTGHTIDPKWEYIGTVIQSSFVWHLFEPL